MGKVFYSIFLLKKNNSEVRTLLKVMSFLWKHLSWPTPNMSLIREGCDSHGKTSLMSLVGYHWATGGIQVSLSPVKGGLISFHLFQLKDNAILPMTAQAGCEGTT